LIDFVSEVKDATTGVTMSNVRDYVNIKLSGSTAILPPNYVVTLGPQSPSPFSGFQKLPITISFAGKSQVVDFSALRRWHETHPNGQLRLDQ